MNAVFLLGLGATCVLTACAPSGISTTAPSAPVSRELKFKGYKGLEIVGTFLAPSGAKKAPAVLILAGSGPTDRDGNSGQLKIELLKDIAEKLASVGVASLRYDKRAVPGTYLSLFPKDHAEWNDFFSFEAFTGDAAAGLAALKALPEVDPNRTAVLGQSEGGLIALSIAQEAKPKGLILVSCAGRDLGTVVIEQIHDRLQTQVQDATLRDRLDMQTKEAVASIRKDSTVPSDLDTGLAAVFPSYATRLLHSEMTIDPAALGEAWKGAALIVQGDKDIQVSAERDFPLLRKAMPQATAALIPNATHNLKAYKGPTDPGLFGPALPEALDAIASWAKKNL